VPDCHSQEAREAAALVLQKLVEGCPPAALAAHAADLVQALEAAASDPAPQVTRCFSAGAAALAGALGGAVAQRLALAAMPLLAHARAALRTAALGVFDAAVQHGAGDAVLLLAGHAGSPLEVPLAQLYGTDVGPRVNLLARLSADSSAGVRARFATSAGTWAGVCPEHMPLLLPHLIALLPDTPAAAAALDAVSQAHEKGSPDTSAWEPAGDFSRATSALLAAHAATLLPCAAVDIRSPDERIRCSAAALLEALLTCAVANHAPGPLRHAQLLAPALAAAAADGSPAVAGAAARSLAVLRTVTAGCTEL